MIVKIPLGVDVSHYKEVVDFKLVSPRPVLFITKASEAYPGSGFNHTDSKFVRFFSGMMDINCTRGAYHFFRKKFDAVRQADHFISVLSSVEILDSDILILDVEEGGETAPQLWAWFERVKKVYSNNQLMIYSRKNILDNIIMTQSEKDYFKRIPTWTAGYPYNPDTFSKVPVGYIPDQTKWGEVWLWQYTSHGRIEGITTELGAETDVDLNWIDPKLYAIIGDGVSLGEKVMANQIWVATTSGAKVWDKPGGARTYPDISVNTEITVYATQGEYLLFSSPRSGATKKGWFKFVKNVEDPVPPTEPGNPGDTSPTVVHEVKIYDNGKISVDNGDPY